MSNFIYHIRTQTGDYIGKYTKPNIYQYHLERAAPLYMGYDKSLTNTESEA